MNLKQIKEIEKIINEETDELGIMFYYGGSKLKHKTMYNEKKYQR